LGRHGESERRNDTTWREQRLFFGSMTDSHAILLASYLRLQQKNKYLVVWLPTCSKCCCCTMSLSYSSTSKATFPFLPKSEISNHSVCHPLWYPQGIGVVSLPRKSQRSILVRIATHRRRPITSRTEWNDRQNM
jgi:hypothetical protein